jgi:dihydrodipicolinate synthase/N-acetylneuraminate lyase
MKMSTNEGRLTSNQARGIWAGVTMSWDDADRFDEKSYIANVQRTIQSNAHGIYTTGSTGEFYALDFDEFKRMVDVQAELCGPARMPLQIGCCSDVTRSTIRLMEYAASKPAVGAAQVVLPYWMELSDREMIQFFKDIYTACPDLPLIHYNIPRAKRFLTGVHYLKILEVAPSLIGVKFTHTGQYFGQLADSIAATPNLSYFVGETLLVSAMQIGARGSYSSVILTNPPFMLKLYALARSNEWEAAFRMQRRVADFLTAAEAQGESLAKGWLTRCLIKDSHWRQVALREALDAVRRTSAGNPKQSQP